MRGNYLSRQDGLLLDVRNCRLKKYKIKDKDSECMRGFSLIAKGNIIELFMETVEEQ